MITFVLGVVTLTPLPGRLQDRQRHGIVGVPRPECYLQARAQTTTATVHRYGPPRCISVHTSLLGRGLVPAQCLAHVAVGCQVPRVPEMRSSLQSRTVFST
jgi:hypothetical protein